MRPTQHVLKGRFFYVALYPIRCTAQSALGLHVVLSLADLFIPTQNSASPGSILAMQQ